MSRFQSQHKQNDSLSICELSKDKINSYKSSKFLFICSTFEIYLHQITLHGNSKHPLEVGFP